MSEPHVHVDFAASHALLLAKAIDAAIGGRPDLFTETEMGDLFDMGNMLVTAVDESDEREDSDDAERSSGTVNMGHSSQGN